jgi:hypothetical protein
MIHTKQRSPPIVEDPFCKKTKFCRGSIPFYNLPSPPPDTLFFGAGLEVFQKFVKLAI